MNTTETKKEQGFVVYEYASVTAKDSLTSLYTDCYQNFGWTVESHQPSFGGNVLRFKRNRKIKNRAEVCNLQRKCEKALYTIEKLENSKNTRGLGLSLAIGLVGTAFMAGATFCYLGSFIIACVLLALPGFVCWGLAYPLYKKAIVKSNRTISPKIESQYDAIYESCEKANLLLA